MPSQAITFNGLRVLSLESRRSAEVTTLITAFGGRPLVAPSLREIPLASNASALDFFRRLSDGGFDLVIFLTGAGAEALSAVARDANVDQELVTGLSRVKVVVRGPKSLGVMRRWNVPVWAAAPEPNTWHDVVSVIRGQIGERLDGLSIAVQEYGTTNDELLADLRGRGADVTPVSIYKWALPENLEPLKQAVVSTARKEVDVSLFTTSMQLVHFCQIALELGLEQEAHEGLLNSLIASIGPTTSGEITRRGLRVDLEASHPKLGILVREAAMRSAGIA
jgi:uroporphyrinogen-III synthase